MFYMDIPPVAPVPVMIAQASSAQPVHTKIDRVIGVCRLIQNPPVPKQTAYNEVGPLMVAGIYYKRFEGKDIGFSGIVSLVEKPKHGSLEMEQYGGRYHPEPDYYGPDGATFLVSTDSIIVKVKYSFNVLNNVPGGTDGYDAYEDVKFCPNGEYWTIPNTADEG